MNEITGSRFVDPLTLQPVRLSPGAVAVLAAELKPTGASPLAALLSLKAAPSSADLEALGIPHAGRPNGGTAKGKVYLEALQTLASPEVTLTLAEVASDAPPMKLKLVMGNERAVLADVDTAGLSFSSPMSYSELVNRLARHFENTAQFVEQRAFWPSQLKTLAALFSKEAGPVEGQASAADLRARLQKAGISADDAKGVLEELTRSGAVEARSDGTYMLSENTAFWLTRMGTGQIGELTCVLHDEEGRSARSDTEVRFAGTPKDRVTMIALRGNELKGLAGDSPAEEVGVVCQVMDRPTLTGFLETFLGVAPAA